MDQEQIDDALAEAAETGIFWGEVETLSEVVPTMVRLLDLLPANTKVFLRIKQPPIE